MNRYIHFSTYAMKILEKGNAAISNHAGCKLTALFNSYTEPLSGVNHCGFVWTRVQLSEPWLAKPTIRRRLMVRMFGEVA
jgi:hypothetical protein